MVAGAGRACANCGEDLVPGDRFCAACGGRVDRTCGSCGVMLVSGDRFCPDCGSSQDATGPNASTGSHSSVWDAVVRALRSSLAGEYRITRELGRGGQAAVFLADELALNRQVAIKVLAPGNVSGEREVELFRREAQTVANLKHPHIVTMYSVRQIEDLHLFVMQYIEGRSLAAIIADRGPLPLTAIRAVAFQIGNALQYAHRRNVIHRDVKPANVLFDEDGNAILTDFGIAKDASHTGGSTLTASFMGTAAYMSPEQCQQRPATWATDQYSLGVLLYEMLTGSVPYEGSPFAVMQGHTDREPPSIRAVRGDCPVELEWAVVRMLAKRPTDRWPSIPDALAALGAGPLTRDDPIRVELKRLAKWAVPDGAARPPRVTLRVPEQLEVGESGACEVFSIGPSDATPQRVTATWRVDDTAIAACDDKTGLLKGLAAGTTIVRAETAHGNVDAEVSVVSAAVRDIQFSLSRSTLTVGETMALVCEPRDRRGNRVSVPVEWQVSETSIASIQADGSISAHAPGMTSVIARVGEVSAERSVFVQEANAASLVIDGGRSPLLVPETLMLNASVFDANGNLLPSREIRWKSDDLRVATVDRYGVVRAVSMGDVLICAQSGSAIAEMSIAIAEAPVQKPQSRRLPIDLGLELATGDSPRAASTPREVNTMEWNRPPSSERPAFAATESGQWKRDSAKPEDEVASSSANWRNFSRKRYLMIAAPVLALALGGWAVSAQMSANARAHAQTILGAEVLAGMAEVGKALDRVVLEEPFTNARSDSLFQVSQGVLTLTPGKFGYGAASWNARAAEFVVHVDVILDRSVPSAQGGLMLQASDGAAYYVVLFTGARPGYRVSLKAGPAEIDVTPFRPSASVRAGVNRLDAVVADGSLSVFINDARVEKSIPLTSAADGQAGVIVGPSGGVSFDNWVIGVLKRN